MFNITKASQRKHTYRKQRNMKVLLLNRLLFNFDDYKVYQVLYSLKAITIHHSTVNL